MDNFMGPLVPTLLVLSLTKVASSLPKGNKKSFFGEALEANKREIFVIKDLDSNQGQLTRHESRNDGFLPPWKIWGLEDQTLPLSFNEVFPTCPLKV